MLRIIMVEVDEGAAVNVGGPVHVSHKTFDVELPELEKLLRDKQNYHSRSIQGVELLAEDIQKDRGE